MGCGLHDGKIYFGGNLRGNGSVNIGDLYQLAEHEFGSAYADDFRGEFEMVMGHTEGGQPSYRLLLPDTPETRAFLRKYVKPDGAGLTELGQQELARVQAFIRSEARAVLPDNVVERMGGEFRSGKIEIGRSLRNSDQIGFLFKLAENEGIEVYEIPAEGRGSGLSGLRFQDTPEARKFLQKYISPDGTGLTAEAQDIFSMVSSEGRVGNVERAAAIREGGVVQIEDVDLTDPQSTHPSGQNASANRGSTASEAPRSTNRGRTASRAGAGMRGIAGSVVKWGARGLGVGFAAWAGANFISDISRLGEAGANAGADGVSVQTPMPEAYAGQISQANQKYFTKGSPEELQFRAMVAYAALQEGGFMGMTQEEWQEYAVRLSEAGGIIDPQAELKIRKALVQAYPEYERAIKETFNNGSNTDTTRSSDASRGLREGGGGQAVPAREGQESATPQGRRRRGGGSRSGF